MKTSHKTDPNLIELISELKRISRENNAPIWRDIALRLEKPRRNWAAVNVGHICRNVRKGEVVVVPGKVLGAGDIDKAVTVATFNSSRQAEDKITTAGGKVMSLREMADTNPKGKKVRIIG